METVKSNLKKDHDEKIRKAKAYLDNNEVENAVTLSIVKLK